MKSILQGCKTNLKAVFKTAAAIIMLLWIMALPCLAADILPQQDPCSCDSFPDLYLKKPCLQGADVFGLQSALSSLGFYRGDLTGQYDSLTAQAVRLFQTENGISPDGVVRYHVWLRLAAQLDQAVTAKKMPPPSGEVTVVIDTFRRRLIILNDSMPYAQFPIAIGKAETPSPVGNWKVINKAVNWGTGFGTRWMGLNVPWGVYGIHGTNKPWSIGSMASHGCFRMWNKDVETIYPWISRGTAVVVVGNPFGYMSGGLQRLHTGEKNTAVIFVQDKLKRRGFYKGNPDGLFGPATEKAVLQFQGRYGLAKTGQIGYEEYKALGIWE